MSRIEVISQKERKCYILNHHYKHQVLQATEAFLVSEVPVVREFIVKLWKELAFFQIFGDILQSKS